jgi:hypothetical protein
MDALERLVHDTLADASRSAPAPIGMPEHRDRARTRSRFTALGVAAAVLAIALAATTAGLLGRGSSPSAPAPVLVGFGKVAIPLPSGWGLNDQDRCGTPKGDTIVVVPWQGNTDLCLTAQPPGAMVILIDHLSGALASRWAATATEHFRLLDGTPALRGQTTAEGAVPGAGLLTGRRFVRVVVVPSLDVVAVGISPTPGALDDAMTRLSPMPPGTVAVQLVRGQPWAEAAERLERLGLTPQQQTGIFGNSPPGWVFSTTPSAGVVVRKGSTIVVHVSR